MLNMRTFASQGMVLLVLAILCYSTVYYAAKASFVKVFETTGIFAQNTPGSLLTNCITDLLSDDASASQALWSYHAENKEDQLTQDFVLYTHDVAVFNDGFLHNAYGPAIVRSDGNIEYWLWGMKLSKVDYDRFVLQAREIEPAIGGAEMIYQDNKLSLLFLGANEYERSWNDDEHSFSYVKNLNGTKVWSVDGTISKDDGPAIVFADGRQWYLKDGKFDRRDGPAIDSGAVNKPSSFWINGRQISAPEYYARPMMCVSLNKPDENRIL